MKRKIAVFIGSPGDLSTERKLFKDAIRQLNVGFGDGANVEFEALGWEDTLASTGRRNQSVINEEVDRCNVFVLVMYRRWGQEAPDANPFSSYTEEEFHRALERWKKEGTPEIFVFFKRVDPTSEADPGPQLKKVMEFRKQLEDSRQLLYHYFENDQSFIDEVDRHLRAYAKGELPKADTQKDIVVLPSVALEEVAKAKALALQKVKEANEARDAEKEAYLKVEALQLQMAQDAATLSREGKIEFARQKFASLVVESNNIMVLSLGYEFYNRTGDLDAALSVLEKWLNISGPEEKSVETATAYGSLGILYQTRGELQRAEAMFEKSLGINDVLGRKEGMAGQYGNLGGLFLIRGELERAEEMFQKSLALAEELNLKESIANTYGNLGILFRTRGNFELAEAMYEKSLAIEEALGRKQGMAQDYGNLGSLYQVRGEVERAEAMYQKALAINEAIGRKEGMANQFGNLALLYQGRGELERAEELYQKALDINIALGRKEGMANQYGNLATLYQERGEIEHAEAMYRQSLAIEEALGHQEGMAQDYGNLGTLYNIQGELETAEEMFQKALDLNKTLGRKDGMSYQYGNLGTVYLTRGELQRAEEMFQQALAIEEGVGRKDVIAELYLQLGIVYLTWRPKTAEEMLQKALEILKEVKSPLAEKVTVFLQTLDTEVPAELGDPRREPEGKSESKLD